MEEAMFRNVVLAVASLAFAGAAFADCDASHAAKRVITDDQAQATPPATKSAAAPAPQKKQVARESGERSKQKTTPNSVALARDSTPPADKPAN
jgi:hypothetical protein